MLTKIDLRPRAQSLCYHQHIDGKDFFWKEYEEVVTRSILEVYHTLHQKYAGPIYYVDLHKPIDSLHGEISRISFTILPLDVDGIGEAQTITERKETLVTMPSYIGGLTLSEFLPMIEDEMSLSSRTRWPRIIDAVHEKLPASIKIEQNLAPSNIKVISLKDGLLELLITDLAMSVADYVIQYEKNIAENL